MCRKSPVYYRKASALSLSRPMPRCQDLLCHFSSAIEAYIFTFECSDLVLLWKTEIMWRFSRTLLMEINILESPYLTSCGIKGNVSTNKVMNVPKRRIPISNYKTVKM
jgi:hypothetical protein